MLRKMTERAGITPYLTNHSLRAKTVTVFSSSNIETWLIKAITGHKSDFSIAFKLLRTTNTSPIQGNVNRVTSVVVVRYMSAFSTQFVDPTRRPRGAPTNEPTRVLSRTRNPSSTRVSHAGPHAASTRRANE